MQIKTFDDTGKILTIVDGDGNYLYGEPATEEESSTGIAEEESTDWVTEEESTEEAYISVCPCSDCTEWECECECESEEVCECIQCKRYTNTVEDESGNVLAEENFDGTKTMKTQNTYTSDGNYLSSSVDTSGNIVYYVYDEAGFLQSMTSGDTEVLFDYDAMGNLTQLSQQVNGLYGEIAMFNQYTYTDDKIASITHNGFSYNFTYDEWGNQASVKIGENTLVEYEYTDREGSQISEITYATGKSVSYTYNDDGNITGVSYDGGESNVYEYTYDSDGALTQITDNGSGFITSYSESGTQIRTIDGDILLYSSVYNEDGTETENILGTAITYTYNSDYNQVTGKTVSTKSFAIESVMEEESTAYSVEQDVDMSVTTDWFGRTENKKITVDSVRTNVETEETSEFYVEAKYGFVYDDTETTASTKVVAHSSSFISEDYTNSKTDYYEYDASGNITGIYRYVDGVKTYYYLYEYDEAGQLIRENILEDNKTILYIYDPGGNIRAKGEFDYTLDEITEDMSAKSFCYYEYNNTEWQDQLTYFEYQDATSDGDDYILSDLTYDAAGNVTFFDGCSYTWNANRQLESVTNEDGDVFRYTYNENGYLTYVIQHKTDGTEGSRLEYIWDGDVLISRKNIDSDNTVAESKTIYDIDGEAIGIIFRQYDNETDTGEHMLLYRKNLQGDVTGVVDSLTGELLGSFTYDAYGMPGFHQINDNFFSILLSAYAFILFPQTYRGYTYSLVGNEICYYLGSRFYIPKIGRFLNADKHFDTGTGVLGTNMFAYCNNNPVTFIDPDGEALSMLNIINYIAYLFKPISSLSKNYNNLSNSYKKKINNECIEILKRYRCIQKNLATNTFYKHIITSSKYTYYDDKTIINMKVTSTHSLGGDLFIIAQFDFRTVAEWYAYMQKSISELIPIYPDVKQWCEQNDPFMFALGECATGKLADVLLIWDTIEFILDIIDKYCSTAKERYVISELRRLGYTAESDDYLIILDNSYSYQTKFKWWYTHPKKYNEYSFSPY